MQLSSPTARRALIAIGALGVLAAIGWTLLPAPAPKTPLEGAQLAGTRGIRLEGEQPVPRFDDERAPIIVAPPAEGQWSAFAAHDGSRERLSVVVEPVDDVQRVRVQPPLPIGRWDLVLEDDTRQTRWPVRFAMVPQPSDVIVRLKAEAEALDVKARPAFWASAAKAETIADRQVAAVQLGRAWIASGDLAQATLAYREAARLAGEMGEIGEQAGRLRAAAWTLYRQRRFEDALVLLADAARISKPSRDAQGDSRIAYLRGCVENEVGLYRSALASLEGARRAAERFDDQRLASTCANELATLLSNLGQHRRALALLQQTPPDGSARGRRLSTRGWITARLARQAPELAVPARVALEESLLHLRNPDVRYAATINLIELEITEARFDAARSLIEGLDEETASFGRTDLSLIRGQLALEANQQSVAEAIHLEVLANPSASLEHIWRANLGLALGARQAADLPTARQYIEAALDVAERLSRRAAVSAGRATWLADRHSLVNLAVGLHVQDEPRKALAMLDATRAWVFRDLEARLRVERLTTAARSDWLAAHADYRGARAEMDALVSACDKKPTDERDLCLRGLAATRDSVDAAFQRLYAVLDEAAPSAITDARLPKLAPGRALLTAVQLGEQTLAFWLQGETVTAIETTLADPIGPVAQRLAGLEHVYVVGAAGLNLRKAVRDALIDADTTWSEVPFAGLLAHPQMDAQGPPVVIADPASDLRHARAEGRAVHDRLGGALLMGAQATRAATLAALRSGARVLHFAGHGALDAESPWQAHLVLANDEQLTLADLLVARPILGIVVLSGCETGVRGALSSQHAVGLPDAFLLSGARAVIATDRVVPDADARAFVDHFYKHPDWATRPAAAFHSAVRAMRAAGNPIWTAFRLMGRA